MIHRFQHFVEETESQGRGGSRKDPDRAPWIRTHMNDPKLLLCVLPYEEQI